MLKTSTFINLLTAQEKAEYVDLCWDMLEKAYASIGGFKSAVDKDDLIHDSHIWKLARKDGKIVACCIYKERYGRKAIGMATDGSSVGKAQLQAIMKEDLTRAWVECSGAVEKALMRIGGEKYMVPASYAETLTGKACTPSDDGFHYTRTIGGKPIEKVIIGTPEGITIDRRIARVCLVLSRCIA